MDKVNALAPQVHDGEKRRHSLLQLLSVPPLAGLPKPGLLFLSSARQISFDCGSGEPLACKKACAPERKIHNNCGKTYSLSTNTMSLQKPTISILGRDPSREHRINANSFQQNAITTVNGWQYVAFYTEAGLDESGSCYVNLSRRQIFPGEVVVEVGDWETLTFKDYAQTHDDGHNTVSIGICRGDGTIHMAFDHHCDP